MTNFRESISEKMKIAIPTDGNKGLNETVAEHFGRCKTYTFLDEIGKVIEVLGNGKHVTCQDTVPFALWCAAKNINNYRQALIDCSIAGGDVDTTSAIVGGIVGIVDPPPEEWIKMCQPLDVRWRTV